MAALKQWQQDHYRPVRMVVSAVGGVDHSTIEKLSEKHFGDLSNSYPGEVPHVSFVFSYRIYLSIFCLRMLIQADGIRFTGSEFRFRNDNVPHMYGAIAVEVNIFLLEYSVSKNQIILEIRQFL